MATVNKVGQDWIILRKWINDKADEHTTALVMSSENDDIHRGALRILAEMVAMVEPDELPETTDPDYA